MAEFVQNDACKMAVTNVRSAIIPNTGLPVASPLRIMYAGINRNVQCKNTGMPAAVPIRIDLLMILPLKCVVRLTNLLLTKNRTELRNSTQ